MDGSQIGPPSGFDGSGHHQPNSSSAAWANTSVWRSTSSTVVSGHIKVMPRGLELLGHQVHVIAQITATGDAIAPVEPFVFCTVSTNRNSEAPDAASSAVVRFSKI